MGWATDWQRETRWAVNEEAVELARQYGLGLEAWHEMNGSHRKGLHPGQADRYAESKPWTVSIELASIRRLIEQPRTPWDVVRSTVYLDYVLREYKYTPYAAKIKAAIRRGGR